MAKQINKRNERADLRRHVREIADSLAIAFILAMVIRHFVLEVFKIPTKSMQPTLLGDPWTGDKILVNKFAYDLRDPQRWDVIVFRYPVDTSRNYIKRVVGLPGETILVRGGDVYINGEIARKPWRVQRALWRRRSHAAKPELWRPEDERYWQIDGHSFVVACRGSPTLQYLTYEREILAYEERDFRGGRQFVRIPTSDIMVQFELTPRKMRGEVQVRIDVQTAATISEVIDRWLVRFPLDEQGCQPKVYRAGDHVATGESCSLEAGRATLIQVCNVDRALTVRVGGREVVRYPYEPSRHISEWPGFGSEPKVEIGCRLGHVAIEQPTIYADIYYTRNPERFAVRNPFKIGSDEFFVMGDNSANSNDSRQWRTVPRRYLVGEAFLVLWPLGRMRTVR